MVKYGKDRGKTFRSITRHMYQPNLNVISHKGLRGGLFRIVRIVVVRDLNPSLNSSMFFFFSLIATGYPPVRFNGMAENNICCLCYKEWIFFFFTVFSKPEHWMNKIHKPASVPMRKGILVGYTTIYRNFCFLVYTRLNIF